MPKHSSDKKHKKTENQKPKERATDEIFIFWHPTHALVLYSNSSILQNYHVYVKVQNKNTFRFYCILCILIKSYIISHPDQVERFNIISFNIYPRQSFLAERLPSMVLILMLTRDIYQTSVRLNATMA